MNPEQAPKVQSWRRPVIIAGKADAAQGSNRHMHLCWSPGYWERHAGKVLRRNAGGPEEVWGGNPHRHCQGGGLAGNRRGPYYRRSRVMPRLPVSAVTALTFDSTLLFRVHYQ